MLQDTKVMPEPASVSTSPLAITGVPHDYLYLNAAIKLKREKVAENNAAMITELLSDAQTAVASLIVAKNALVALSLAPFVAGALPLIMLTAAVPAVLSLVSEIKKDNKDLRILEAIKTKYDESQDIDILKETRLLVKMHCPHHDIDAELAEKGIVTKKVPVKMQYRDMNPAIRSIVEEREKSDKVTPPVKERLKSAFEGISTASIATKSRWALGAVFNAYALSIKVCTVQLPKTISSVKEGLSEVWRLVSQDRAAVYTTMTTPTLYESLQQLRQRKEQGHSIEVEGDAEQPIFNKDSLLHIRKLHTMQLDIRNNAKQRAVTAVGTTAVFSFVSLAVLQSALSFASGNVVQGTAYLMTSALLSVPSLRVLSDRLNELAENDRDQDLKLVNRMARHGL